MPVSVSIPAPYRDRAKGASRVAVRRGTVRQVLQDLAVRYPALGGRLLTLKGKLPPQVAVYVNGVEVRTLQGAATPVREGDEVDFSLAATEEGRPGGLTKAQIDRYSRQILLPEVGVEGQRRLLAARVLIVGAGGLGSPAATYLAAAGVGTLGIIDHDRVERSNLHRQPIHREADVGRPKAQSAARFLAGLNPEVRVISYDQALSAQNALEILKDYDVVVNGSDNFPTRYLVNDACFFLQKPLVDASILRFAGQAVVFVPGEGCYRCLYPTPPEPGTVPSCAEAGVMGALAGQMGALQAMEALKLILGLGEGLRGRILLYDALSCQVRFLAWKRDPACPLCGDRPSVTGLVDYEAFCGLRPPEGGAEEGGAAIDPEAAWDLLRRGKARFVDVREADRYREGTIPGATSLPLGRFPEGLRSLRGEDPVVFFCDIGRKSAAAAKLAEAAGLRAKSMTGGLVVWRGLGLPWEAGV